MGYDPDYFVSENGVDESLLCPVCQSVYDTPMVLDPCGHSFCKECVATLLNSGHENCPVCRTKMIGGDDVGVPPNRALKDLISNMTVRCMNCPNESDNHHDTNSNSDTACSWTGKLSEFQSHSERDCRMHIVSCPIEGCDFEGPRCSMNQHNADSVALHTTLLVAAEVQKIREELLGATAAQGMGTTTNGGASSSVSSESFGQLQYQLEQKNHEINKLKARLLDNWLSDFFREWIIAKPPYFENFVVYRPIKYLTGPISQIIAGIPGPGNSDWEGGLFPLLITFTPEGFERKEPPKCDFPENFFHPNVHEGNVHVNVLAEFEGSWDPSISLPEILFCIQQLLTHPNHPPLYDSDEYRENVRLQAEKYQRSSADFLERAMVELQSKIDPEYKKPLESWENVRWENLEEVRWKGKRPFQRKTNESWRMVAPMAHPTDTLEEEVEFEVATNPSSASLSQSGSNDEHDNNDENENNDENNAPTTPSHRSILAPIANANSTDLSSPSRQIMPAGRVLDEDGNVCECSCCEQGGRFFLDRKHNMRYLFAEGG